MICFSGLKGPLHPYLHRAFFSNTTQIKFISFSRVDLNMKLKRLIAISVLLCLLFLSSCTNTPWHRDQADASLKKGMALIEAEQYLGALKELLEADKNAPNDATINYYLGIAHLGRGLKDMALEKFQKAVSLKSDYSEAHNYIGIIYMDREQWEKAIDSFDKALKNYLYANPEHALYNAGWSYYNLHNYDKAMTCYQQALIQDKLAILQPDIEKNIGLIYVKQIKLTQAKMHFEKSVALNPSLYDAHFFLAETYLNIRDTENAKKSFQQVIKLAPQSPFAQKAREYLQSLQ